MAPAPIDTAALMADLANVTSTPKKGPSCSVAVVLNDLPNDVADAILAKIDSPETVITELCRVLEKHDTRISVGAVRRHRRRGTAGGCMCPRENEAAA